MCWPRNGVGRTISGSLIYDYSGTCVIALRDRPHETPAWHQAQAVEETTQPGAAVRLGGARAGGRSSSEQSGNMTAQLIGCDEEWRLSRVAA